MEGAGNHIGKGGLGKEDVIKLVHGWWEEWHPFFWIQRKADEYGNKFIGWAKEKWQKIKQIHL